MTEASHQMTSNPLPKNGPHKPGTVGLAQGTVKVAVLDNSNERVAQRTIGEVCLQGPNVTKGYLNNPKANEEGFAGTLLGYSLLPSSCQKCQSSLQIRAVLTPARGSESTRA